MMRRNKPALSIDLIFEASSWGKSRLSARNRVRQVLDTAWQLVPDRPEGITAELTVTLTDDAHIQILNRDYRGKDKSTNVLSFPMFESLHDLPSGAGSIPLGDIIIAFETIDKEAREQQKVLSNHFSHMLIHGFLHLLGYDHMNDKDAETMESLEIKILKQLSISNPYQ